MNKKVNLDGNKFIDSIMDLRYKETSFFTERNVMNPKKFEHLMVRSKRAIKP
jgi:hypothetical protein